MERFWKLRALYNLKNNNKKMEEKCEVATEPIKSWKVSNECWIYNLLNPVNRMYKHDLIVLQ